MVPRRVLVGASAFLLGFAVIILAGKVVFPGMSGTLAVPNGEYLQGTVVGLLNALLAVGLVLVYRANRIINFAQGELGAFAAVLTSELYQRVHWPFLPSVLAGILAAVLTSMAVEFLVVRRFYKAPRLILTVATIGVAQILGAIELIIPYLFNRDVQLGELRTSLKTPFTLGFEFGQIRFRADHVVVLVLGPVILVGLAMFLRRSRYGVAARAVAENDDRARLLGVKVRRISLIIWGLAGLLSGLTAILRAPVLGFQFGAIGGQSLLLRALAAGVIARMESLPVTVGAALLLTMAERAIFFSYGRSGPTDGFLLAVIVVALLAQHKRIGRAAVTGSSWQAIHEVRPVPRELRGLPEVRWVFRGAAAFGLGLLAMVPLLVGVRIANLAAVTLLYAIVGVSLVMLTGWSGNVSLGQWAIVGFGGLTAARLATTDPPQDYFVSLLVAGLVGAAVSLGIGLPALRIRGLFLGVTTLALALAAHSWFFQFEIFFTIRPIIRPVLFGLWDMSSENAYYYLCLAGLVFALVVARNIRRARLGRVLIAVRDNEGHAQALGIRLTVNKLMSFAVSGFLAAMAGGLFAYHQGALRGARFPAEGSLQMFSMAVIGGMGSASGAILGAGYVFGSQYFLPPAFRLLATGFGLMLLLLVFPGGLGQILYGFRDRYLRWVADRRGLVVPSLIADRQVDVTTVPVGGAETKAGLVGAGERP